MFPAARQVPGHGLCGVAHFLFTAGLVTGLKFYDDGLESYDHEARYCYANWADALYALRTWDGVNDPPGPWIKEKLSNRPGPGARKLEDGPER